MICEYCQVIHSFDENYDLREASRDVDGDNRTDFILGDSPSKEFFVLKNTSKMWASSSQNFDSNDIVKIDMETNLPGAKRPFQVLMLDVDNDGLTDILKVGEDQIFVIRGDRNRIFISSLKAIIPSPFFQSQGKSPLNPILNSKFIPKGQSIII